MNNFLIGPACPTSNDCPAPAFPTAVGSCFCNLAYGGINDIYVIPCTETFSFSNIIDLAWWQQLISGGNFHQLGKGIGNFSKKETKTEILSSCGIAQPISATWAAKYTIKCFDKSSADVTRERINALVLNSSKYLIIARLCDGEDTILPIGKYSPSDFDWLHPEQSTDAQNVMVEFSWNEFPLPKLYSIAGLSTVVPKAAA